MTVSELVAWLRDIPPDTPVVITDADTYWLLDITSVEHVENGPRPAHVALGGTYHSEFR